MFSCTANCNTRGCHSAPKEALWSATTIPQVLVTLVDVAQGRIWGRVVCPAECGVVMVLFVTVTDVELKEAPRDAALASDGLRRYNVQQCNQDGGAGRVNQTRGRHIHSKSRRWLGGAA